MIPRFALFLVCVLLCVPQVALGQQPVGEQELVQRAVQLQLLGSNGSFACLGFRLYRAEFPPDVDLVFTAAHCVRSLGANPLIRVATLNGRTGRARYWLSWKDYDVALLLVTPKLGPLTPVHKIWRNPPRGLPILALITIGGGRPTPASGKVQAVSGAFVHLLLPAGHGTSGGGVVDLSGVPVGMVAAGDVAYTAGSASYLIKAVSINTILQLMNSQQQQLVEKAREISLQ